MKTMDATPSAMTFASFRAQSHNAAISRFTPASLGVARNQALILP
jgi:hypothetical protein